VKGGLARRQLLQTEAFPMDVLALFARPLIVLTVAARVRRARALHEEGESAKTTDRSQLQRLLTYCRLNKGRVHFVVVFNLTRFAGDPPVPRGLRRARQVRPFCAPLSAAVAIASAPAS